MAIPVVDACSRALPQSAAVDVTVASVASIHVRIHVDFREPVTALKWDVSSATAARALWFTATRDESASGTMAVPSHRVVEDGHAVCFVNAGGCRRVTLCLLSHATKMEDPEAVGAGITIPAGLLPICTRSCRVDVAASGFGGHTPTVAVAAAGESWRSDGNTFHAPFGPSGGPLLVSIAPSMPELSKSLGVSSPKVQWLRYAAYGLLFFVVSWALQTR